MSEGKIYELIFIEDLYFDINKRINLNKQIVDHQFLIFSHASQISKIIDRTKLTSIFNIENLGFFDFLKKEFKTIVKKINPNNNDIFIISNANEFFTLNLEKIIDEVKNHRIFYISKMSTEHAILEYQKGVGPVVFSYLKYRVDGFNIEELVKEKFNTSPIDAIIERNGVILKKENQSSTKRKIIDCFIFNDELDILELRLKLLNDHVDHFVLVESRQTHSGIDKETHFEKNMELFKEYRDKLISVVIDKFPDEMLYNPSESDVPEDLKIHWFRENFQRNSILKGLYTLDLDQNDIILISDVDEIPDPNKLEEFINSIPENTFSIQLQKWFCWDFHRFYDHVWPGTGGIRWCDLLKITPQEVRARRYDETIPHTEEFFGWHLSWFGGIDRVMKKLQSFAHQELRELSQEYIENKMTMNLDLHGHDLLVSQDGYRPIIK